MKLLSVASLALFGVAKIANAQEVEETAAVKPHHYHHPPGPPPPRAMGVRATFTNYISGAEGSVTITDHTDISAKIRITDFNKIELVENWPRCASGGLIWTIQEHWPENSSTEMFGDDCNDEALGRRYDPSFACSDLSQYNGLNFCQVAGPNFALNQDSDYLEGEGFDLDAGKRSCPPFASGEYNCWPCLYHRYNYACEVGDFSGKYGHLQFHTSCDGPTVREAGESKPTEAIVQAAIAQGHFQEAAGYHCNPGTHAHFKVHDRFMDKPSLYRSRPIRLSCNDGSAEGIPLMCAKLVSFVDYHDKHY